MQNYFAEILSEPPPSELLLSCFFRANLSALCSIISPRPSHNPHHQSSCFPASSALTSKRFFLGEKLAHRFFPPERGRTGAFFSIFRDHLQDCTPSHRSKLELLSEMFRTVRQHFFPKDENLGVLKSIVCVRVWVGGRCGSGCGGCMGREVGGCLGGGDLGGARPAAISHRRPM